MPPRVRVAFAVDSFRIGGTEVNAARTAVRLDRNRFELVVVCLQNEGELREQYERAGIPVHHFPIRSLYKPGTARQGMKLARFLRAHRTQVLHAHDVYTNCFAVPWARVAGIPAVIASRRWWYTVPRPALIHANRMAYRLAHRVLANSPSVARLLTVEEGVSPARVMTIPNFVEQEAFAAPAPDQRLSLRARFGLAEQNGVPVIGIVARLDPVKDHETLLKAARLLTDRGRQFRLVIVGDGDRRHALEQMAAALGLSGVVQFAGQLPPRPNLHSLFDVSVLCSTAEGFPNSVIEAMAAGKPVVATRVGGIPDAVEEGKTGYLVPPGDAAALATSLDSLLGDERRRAAFGEAGRAAALDRFGERSVIGSLEEAYTKLAGPPR